MLLGVKSPTTNFITRFFKACPCNHHIIYLLCAVSKPTVNILLNMFLIMTLSLIFLSFKIASHMLLTLLSNVYFISQTKRQAP